MLFYSFEFMYLFLPITIIGYYLLGSKTRKLSVIWIVLCSLFFYGWWNPYFIFFLIGSVLFNYYLGLTLRGFKNKTLLIVSIAVNLGFIGYFKYFGFLVSIVTDLTGKHFSIGNIILPLGISFFTFQQISWLVDNYTDNISNRDRGVWEYGQFVMFFPQLIAGPIVHHSEMMPQFYEDKNRFVNWENIAAGISIFVIGLAKKVIIADAAAPYANIVFDAAQNDDPLLFVDAWVGALAYTVQIYFDFSGYADMAIGLALMFNIHLPLNFDSPYKSISISNFWRRWHMSLGRFFRDYVYIPLGGSRCGQLKYYTNLLLTMFICGVWHGAGWTFILWGALHGVYMVIDQLWSRFGPVHLPRFIATGITFISVVFAWVLFRAETLNDAWIVMQSMCNFSSANLVFHSEQSEIVDGLFVVVPALLICFILPNSQEFLDNFLNASNPNKRIVKDQKSRFIIWQTNIYWAVAITILSIVSIYCLIDQTNVQEFIYFQF